MTSEQQRDNAREWRYLNTVLSHSIVDELVIVRLHLIQALLNHVIAIQVLDQSHDVALQDNHKVIKYNISGCDEGGI